MWQTAAMRVTVIVDPSTSTDTPLPASVDLAAAWQKSVPSAHTSPVTFPTSVRAYAMNASHNAQSFRSDQNVTRKGSPQRGSLSLCQMDTDAHIVSVAQSLATAVGRTACTDAPMQPNSLHITGGGHSSVFLAVPHQVVALDHAMPAPRGWWAFREFLSAVGVTTTLQWGQVLDPDVIKDFSAALREVSERIDSRALTVLWDQPTPLTGFHGLSATNALDEVVESQEAQHHERWLGELADKIHPPTQPLLAEQSTARQRARADGSGAGGGLAWFLSLLGVRHTALAPWLWHHVDLSEQCKNSDLIVVVQQNLDARTLSRSAAGLAGAAAQNYAVPVIVLTHDCLMNRRELAEHGVTAAYTSSSGDLLHDAQRIARSWNNLL